MASKTDSLLMKLFTCLIGANVPQLCCLNDWNYSDCCRIKQVIWTDFSIEFSIYKTDVTSLLCSHSNSPAAFAKWSMYLWIKNMPPSMPPHFFYLLFKVGVHCGLREALWKGPEEKNKKPSNVPLAFEKSCVMMESTAYLGWDGEHRSATRDMLSAARVLENCCNASIFQTCCRHVCTCAERSETWGALQG